tara:strand:- start:2625 stop:3167 length:543 start_codon:yes stop_codon:yes gene_type:complete
MNPVDINHTDTILQPENSNLNGRVNIVDIPQKVLFEMQEKIAVKNKTSEYREALQGIWEDSILSKAYFSKENIQIVQNGLRAGVHKMSGEKYIIAPQNVDTLKIIMRSIFIQHAEHNENDITGQIVKLNNLVLDYAVLNVYNEIDGYVKYCRDQSTLVVPMELPKQVDREFRQLEMKNWV